MFDHWAPTRGRCVNAGEYRVSLVAIRFWKSCLESQRIGRVAVRISQKSWAPRPPFLGHPIHPLISAKGGPIWLNFRPQWRRRENDVRNKASGSAIRVWGVTHLASRWMVRISVRIFRKSRAPIRHFWEAPSRGCGWMELGGFCARRLWCVNGVIYRVSVSTIRVRKESRLVSRLIDHISVRISQKSRAAVHHFRDAPPVP